MPPKPRRPRPPLDSASLSELGLAYVARFATSRAKLAHYLARKVRERGWEGGEDASGSIDAVADRLADLRYVDDRAYAAAKARSLTGRGFGPRRLSADLAAAGISDDDRDGVAIRQGESALHFARKRRIGPFALAKPDAPAREKQLAAMLRAGHSMKVARLILDCSPGEMPDLSSFDEMW